jgi:hypothetical protein
MRKGYILDALRRACSSLDRGAEPSGEAMAVGEHGGREDA